MRRAATRFFQHLVLIQWKELFVHPRPPRESIDAIKSLDVIDATEVKDAPDGADALPPPLKIVRAHSVPAVEGNPPVLAPSLRERIVFEVRFGRCAADPVDHKFFRTPENVCAAITDAEGNISH